MIVARDFLIIANALSLVSFFLNYVRAVGAKVNHVHGIISIEPELERWSREERDSESKKLHYSSQQSPTQ